MKKVKILKRLSYMNLKDIKLRKICHRNTKMKNAKDFNLTN